MKRLSRRSLIVVSLTLTLASHCRRDESAEPPRVRVGLLALMDGLGRETSGVPSIAGAEIAVDAANRRGGVVIGSVPHRVELVIEHYEDRPDSATGTARALINQARVDALLGPQFSRHAIAVASIAESARVPMVSPMSSNPETTAGKRYVFRLAARDGEQAAAIAHFASRELDSRRAAVLYDVSTSYGRSLAQGFREEYGRLSGEVVAFESFVRDGPMDHSAQLGRIAEAEVDVLYLPSEIDRVLPQIAEARALDVDAVLLGSDTWDVKYMVESPDTDGAYYTHQWHHELDNEASERFVELYRERHDDMPRATAAMTYDGMRLLLDAFERAGSLAPEAVRNALSQPRTFASVAGQMTFDGGPDPERAVMISRIRVGRSELIARIRPEGADAP